MSTSTAGARAQAPGLVTAVGLTLLALATLGLEARSVSHDLTRERDLHAVDFVGSAACARCHPSHAASFAQTFHRTMTREASRETVLAPFAGEAMVYGGYTATMTTEATELGAPRFVVTLTAPDGTEIDRAVVDRTVGSHRDQQLLAREDDRWVRLPVAWDVEEQRWIHMNEAFLTPDPEGLEQRRIALTDYARHVVSWNDNCVFCHNVGPRPGLDEATGRFATEVAELGVACEACHGPGAEHVAANTNPLRRYALHRGGLVEGQRDPTIVNPRHLSAERASDVCGRCHGQRITDDVGRFLREGDPFVPGEDLALYSAPLFIDTELGGEAAFAARFWDDGTARLTAYEYQGYTQSRCATEGGLGCNDCHGMHEGDPRGQIRPSAAGDAMCVRCHQALGDTPARLAHVAPARGLAAPRDHATAPSAHTQIACVDCHMPRVVYGLRDAHRSHRIDSPPPEPSVRTSDRLDACALCHLDGGHVQPGGVDLDVSPAADLFAGDPIQRAVVAAALGRHDSVAPTVGFSPSERLSLLLESMRDDPYPAVRSIAWASVRALATTPLTPSSFSPTAPRGEREAWVRALATSMEVSVADATVRVHLRRRASQRAIEIGE